MPNVDEQQQIESTSAADNSNIINNAHSTGDKVIEENSEELNANEDKIESSGEDGKNVNTNNTNNTNNKTDAPEDENSTKDDEKDKDGVKKDVRKRVPKSSWDHFLVRNGLWETPMFETKISMDNLKRDPIAVLLELKRRYKGLEKEIHESLFTYGPPYSNDEALYREMAADCNNRHIVTVSVHTSLNAGANPNYPLTIDRGNTAVHYACRHQNFQILKLLCKAGGDLNKKNAIGQSPLALVCKYKPTADRIKDQQKMVQFILEHKVDIDTIDAGGYTPLEYSVLDKNLPVTLMLIAAGAKIHRTSQYFTIAPRLITNATKDPLITFVLEKKMEPILKAQKKRQEKERTKKILEDLEAARLRDFEKARNKIARIKNSKADQQAQKYYRKLEEERIKAKIELEKQLEDQIKTKLWHRGIWIKKKSREIDPKSNTKKKKSYRWIRALPEKVHDEKTLFMDTLMIESKNDLKEMKIREKDQLLNDLWREETGFDLLPPGKRDRVVIVDNKNELTIENILDTM